MLNYKTIEFPSSDVFDRYVKDSLSVSRYENLHDTLDISENWLGRYKNKHSEMKLGTLLLLAEELNVDPYYLVKKYGVGVNAITAGELLSLEAMQTENQPA